MVAKFIELTLFTESFVRRANHLKTVRRGEDLDLQVPRDLTDCFPNVLLHRVVDTVFDFVDEEVLWFDSLSWSISEIDRNGLTPSPIRL